MIGNRGRTEVWMMEAIVTIGIPKRRLMAASLIIFPTDQPLDRAVLVQSP